MTRLNLQASVFTILVCVCSLIRAQVPVADAESVGMSSERLGQVDTVMQKLVNNGELPGGSVLVSRKGKIVYLKSFGVKNLATQEPMTNDTIHRIYSMSKAITSAAVLMLVDEQKIDLDAPVGKYIPEFHGPKVYAADGNRPAKRSPTVRDLLRHTAGLTYGVFDNSPVDQAYKAAEILSPTDSVERMAAKLGAIPLEYDPGTAWKYSVASDVCGRIVEVGSGKSFGEFLQQRIFTPLNMKDTAFHVPAEKLKRFSTNYYNTNGNLAPIDGPDSSEYAAPKPFESGGGGLVSTILDYHQFLQMIANGGMYGETRLLTTESVALMTHNQLPPEAGWVRFGQDVREGVGFGLGFSVRVRMSDWDKGGRIGEYGWGGAASTHYWVSPQDDLIVITMEQIMPYSFRTEFALKSVIYDAINPE